MVKGGTKKVPSLKDQKAGIKFLRIFIDACNLSKPELMQLFVYSYAFNTFK